MNIFIGIGTITDVNHNGRALKFKLNVLQDKPCVVPCLLIDPSGQFKAYIEELLTSEEAVWLQGKISFSEYDYKGQPRRSFQILTFEKGIKAI